MAEHSLLVRFDADLLDLRARIDTLDVMLLKLVAERCALVKRVQRLKRDNGRPVRCRSREQEIFARARMLGRRLGIAEEDAVGVMKNAIDCCLRTAGVAMTDGLREDGDT